MKVAVVLTVLFVGGALCGSSESNEYMDEVLDSFPFDARPLEDVQFNLESKGDVKQILVELYQGKVTGLNKIVREGDCSAPEVRGEDIVLECKLSLKGLKAKYFARVTKPDGKSESTTVELVAESGDLAVRVARVNDPCMTCHRPQVKELKVSNLKLKAQKAKWNGLDEASAVELSKHAAVQAETALSKFLNTKYKKTFANVASYVPMPAVAA